MTADARPNRLFRNLTAKLAAVPMILTAVVIFMGGTAWTVLYSFTDSKLLPRLRWLVDHPLASMQENTMRKTLSIAISFGVAVLIAIPAMNGFAGSPSGSTSLSSWTCSTASPWWCQQAAP